MRLPDGNVPTAVLLLVVVFCNLAADALGFSVQQRGSGDEVTHAVRKVSQSIHCFLALHTYYL